MFNDVQVTKKAAQSATLIPVLIEVRMDGGRVEWAPSDDPENIQQDCSLELSLETCAAILASTQLKNLVKAEMKAGGRYKNQGLIDRFGAK